MNYNESLFVEAAMNATKHIYPVKSEVEITPVRFDPNNPSEFMVVDEAEATAYGVSIRYDMRDAAVRGYREINPSYNLAAFQDKSNATAFKEIIEQVLMDVKLISPQ